MAVLLPLFALNVLAQDEKPDTQGLLIWEDEVPPSKAEAYEAGTKTMLKMYGEHDFPYDVNIYSTEDYRYFWVVNLDDYADVDTLYRDFNRVYKEMGEAGKDKLDEAVNGTFTQTKMWTCLWREDLSYMPENPVDSGNFRYWGFLYVKQGKQEEMREVMKEWVSLYKSKGINRGFGGYEGDMGTEMPFMFYSERGQNQAEFYTAGMKVNEQLGEEGDALWKKTESLLRRYEPLRGWYRKDLSYTAGKE